MQRGCHIIARGRWYEVQHMQQLVNHVRILCFKRGASYFIPLDAWGTVPGAIAEEFVGAPLLYHRESRWVAAGRSFH